MNKIRSAARKGIWISGVNPVKAALQADNIELEEIFFCRIDQRIQELLDVSRNKGISVQQTDRQELSLLVGHSHHQGVALRGADYPYSSLDDLLDQPIEQIEPIVLLDSVQDPQNLGALLRSACFLGAKHVILPKDRAAQVTSAVIKVSAGATAYVPVVRVTNLVTALQQLKAIGLWIIGLDLNAREHLYQADLTVPLGLLVGSEQKGIRPLVRKTCDHLLHIPAIGPMESLNAATAGAIALAEVQRQRLWR
jgi:23S rRNA (guanosine2251-2'-O)-methyltransferase